MRPHPPGNFHANPLDSLPSAALLRFNSLCFEKEKLNKMTSGRGGEGAVCL